MPRTTHQETFWEGEFGDAYVERNTGRERIAANTALFSRILSHTGAIRSVLELGSNIGLNLLALRQLLPEAGLAAVEINAKAADALQAALPEVDLYRMSILEFRPHATWDMVFTKGVLIHIAPEELPAVYQLMYDSASRYVLLSEYYNPTPVEVPYRGHAGKLFKRDFAGELLDRFPDLSLVAYGFAYHGDPHFPQDDMTWFLLEKRQTPPGSST